jgi:poly-gamma-glutamate synthesis protein (capsule biosynthesis protein)
LLVSNQRHRRRGEIGGWFVRQSPTDHAGVLSPPATAAVLLALLLVVSMSLRSVTADASAPSPIAQAHALHAAGTDGRPPPTGPVTLAFGGDVHFEKWLADAVRADPQGSLDPLAALLGDADLAVINLETAVTDRGSAAPKQHTFRAPREAVTALAAAGADVVSIANNHGMDFGEHGLFDTLDAVRAEGLGLIGGGRDEAEAYRPHVAEIRGRRVAVLGATQVLDSFAITAWSAGPDQPGLASAKTEGGGQERLVEAVRRAEADADTVVVMLHWGREKEQCALPHQRELAEELRAVGADIIVGGHAHRLAGGGYQGNAVVGYGLGNLVFYAKNGPATTSGVLTVTIAPDDSTSIAWRPATLRNGVATPVKKAKAARAVAAWEDLRGCSDLRVEPTTG